MKTMLKPVDKRMFHRLFYPTVPVIVTTKSEGKVGGMTAAWSMPLSFIPPLVGVSIAPERYTYRLLMNASHFAINFVDFRHVEKLSFVGDISGRYLEDKFSVAGLTLSSGEATSVPVIEEAVAIVECVLKKRIEVGDHDLFVGEAVANYAAEDFGKTWALVDYSPIFYLGSEDGRGPKRKYVSLGEEVKRIPYATGKADERRREVLRKIEALSVRSAKEKVLTVEEISVEAGRELGMSAIDVQLIVEQLRREGKIKVLKSGQG